MVGSDLITIAQFGFAAIAAYVLWSFIRELIPQLLTVNSKLVAIVEQNSTALAETSAALREVCANVKHQADCLQLTNERLAIIEERHKNGIRECPMLIPDK
jgi:hypothetical protein